MFRIRTFRSRTSQPNTQPKSSQGATERLGSEYFDRKFGSQGLAGAQPRSSQGATGEQPKVQGQNISTANSAARGGPGSSSCANKGQPGSNRGATRDLGSEYFSCECRRQCATKEQRGSNQTFRVRLFRSRPPQTGGS